MQRSGNNFAESAPVKDTPPQRVASLISFEPDILVVCGREEHDTARHMAMQTGEVDSSLLPRAPPRSLYLCETMPNGRFITVVRLWAKWNLTDDEG